MAILSRRACGDSSYQPSEDDKEWDEVHDGNDDDERKKKKRVNLQTSLNEETKARGNDGDWTRPSHLYLYGAVYERACQILRTLSMIGRYGLTPLGSTDFHERWSITGILDCQGSGARCIL
jgi:hypothetical protein